MLTRTYEAFSVLLGWFCSTQFLEHVKLAVRDATSRMKSEKIK